MPRDDSHEPDHLRREIEELRASRMRLVLAADADRRRLERELHDGVQQRLVALAVELQLVEASLGSDPATAHEHLTELARDVDLALAEAARLAERIYPSILAPGGLAPALRAAAADAGIPVRVNVEMPVGCPPELFATVHECFLQVLVQAAAEEVTVTVCDDVERLAFEVVADPARRPELALHRIRDRVEALGGTLTVERVRDAGVRVAGALPLPLPLPLSRS